MFIFLESTLRRELPHTLFTIKSVLLGRVLEPFLMDSFFLSKNLWATALGAGQGVGASALLDLIIWMWSLYLKSELEGIITGSLVLICYILYRASVLLDETEQKMGNLSLSTTVTRSLAYAFLHFILRNSGGNSSFYLPLLPKPSYLRLCKQWKAPLHLPWKEVPLTWQCLESQAALLLRS